MERRHKAKRTQKAAFIVVCIKKRKEREKERENSTKKKEKKGLAALFLLRESDVLFSIKKGGRNEHLRALNTNSTR